MKRRLMRFIVQFVSFLWLCCCEQVLWYVIYDHYENQTFSRQNGGDGVIEG